MKRSLPLFGPMTLVVLVGAGAPARAEFVSFTYNWLPGPLVIAAEGTGGVTLTDGTTFQAASAADTVVGHLTTFSSATPDAPDRFINKSYSLRLDLTDKASQTAGFLDFTGVLNGTLTATEANITNTYATPTTQQLTLGDNTYTVQIGAFPALPAPGAEAIETIQAHISVSGHGPTPSVQESPEPSTLVLAGVGFVLVAIALWRERVGRNGSHTGVPRR
ncbi:MAG: PEP-CTERM sorting domain-containing protein [Gemmataceae bacterium]|nr:PEP-CTERM sorting domain-containing protein [Gemmataceae bacterium]